MTIAPAPMGLGWDAGWDRAFEPYAAGGRRPARVVAAQVEPEGWVAVGHQAHVGGDPEHPPVHAHHEVVDRLRITAGEQQHDRGDQHE
jgi:hypothetical protein